MTEASWLVLCFLLFGIFWELLALLFRGISNKKQNSCTEMTTAEILEYKKRRNGSVEDVVSIEYHPVYKYVVNGIEYEYESARNNNRPGKDIGEKVLLKYNPQKPEMAYVEKDIRLFKLLKICTAVAGAIFIVTAALIYFFA